MFSTSDYSKVLDLGEYDSCSQMKNETEGMRQTCRSLLRQVRQLSHRVRELENERGFFRKRLDDFEAEIRKMQVLQRRSWEGEEQVSPFFREEEKASKRKKVSKDRGAVTGEREDRTRGKSERDVRATSSFKVGIRGDDVRTDERSKNQRPALEELIQLKKKVGCKRVLVPRSNTHKSREHLSTSRDGCTEILDEELPTEEEAKGEQQSNCDADLVSKVNGSVRVTNVSMIGPTDPSRKRRFSERKQHTGDETNQQTGNLDAHPNQEVPFRKQRCGHLRGCDGKYQNVADGLEKHPLAHLLLQEADPCAVEESLRARAHRYGIASSRSALSLNEKFEHLPPDQPVSLDLEPGLENGVKRDGGSNSKAAADDKAQTKACIGKGKEPRELSRGRKNEVTSTIAKSRLRKNRKGLKIAKPACDKCKAALRQHVHGIRLEKAEQGGCIWRLHAHSPPSTTNSLFHLSFDSSD